MRLPPTPPLTRGTPAEPLVSVIIVSENDAPHLPGAVYSVLGQQGVSLELVVVDNASTDGTRDFLATILDPRLKVVLHPTNKGPQAANSAFPLLRGRYVAFLDTHDIALPLRLATQTAYLESHPDLGGCGSLSQALEEGESEEPMLRGGGDSAVVTWALGWRHCIRNSTLLFRRELIGAVGGYNRNLGPAQGYDLISRLTRIKPLAVLDEVLVLCRETRGSGGLRGRECQRAEIHATARAHLGYVLDRDVAPEIAETAIAMMGLEAPATPEHCRAALDVIAEYTTACSRWQPALCADQIRQLTYARLLQFVRQGLPAGEVTRWDIERQMLQLHPRGVLGRIWRRGRDSAPLIATAAVTVAAVRNLGAILGWTPTLQLAGALLWVASITILAIYSGRLLARIPRWAKAT